MNLDQRRLPFEREWESGRLDRQKQKCEIRRFRRWDRRRRRWRGIAGRGKTDELARVALPDGKKCGHTDARKVLLAINAEVFEENVAEGDLSNALRVVHAQCFLHARFVDGIDALRRDANFVERQADGPRLTLEKLTADAVHADALVAFGDGGEQGCDLDVVALENGV